MRRGYDAFNSRDIDAILDMLADSIEYRMPMDPVGQYPVFRGHAGVREFHETIWSAFEEFDAELRDVGRMGDVWVATGRMVARANGRSDRVSWNFTHFWKEDEGQATAVAFHDAMNPFAVLEETAPEENDERGQAAGA